MDLLRALTLKALKMYWIKNTSAQSISLIVPDKYSLYASQLRLYDIVRKLPIFFRFITPHYYIRLGEETAMFLEKKWTLLQDTYLLHKRGNFTDQDEPLLLNSVVLALLYERERLEELYT